jgi:hypothetical protein
MSLDDEASTPNVTPVFCVASASIAAPSVPV